MTKELFVSIEIVPGVAIDAVVTVPADSPVTSEQLQSLIDKENDGGESFMRILKENMKGPATTPGRCCDKARWTNCVCAWSYTCPEHGDKHIGTHD